MRQLREWMVIGLMASEVALHTFWKMETGTLASKIFLQVF